jgi:lysozyme family protein
MSASSYDEALRRLLGHEGGYTNHPSDPGGPTNFGITIIDYRKYVKRNATAADVRGMRLDEAKAIYRAKYWNALRCDELPAGVDYAVFDYGVNSGIARAAKVLQRCLGFSAPTTRVDDAVLRAVWTREPAALVAAICDERLRFLKALRTWPVFGKGWGRRVAEVRRAALAMAGRVAANDTEAKETAAPGKGAVAVNTTAQNGTAGTIAAGGATAAQQAHEAGMRPAIIIAIVVLTVALAVAGFLFWRWRQRRRQLAAA